ncbi:hemerythrin domain-containing protein [Myxococcota bacterium]|nr:hemerythrin domain-containing protein [Myxococcota bacterium]
MSREPITDHFTHDHRDCDAVWAEVEQAGEGERAAAWARFRERMLRHFDWEEGVMFPAFEATTGMRGMGPTEVMRSEHDSMRGLLEQMGMAADQGDLDELLDLGDTLLMLIQQHNSKEERMLYPMMDQVLAGQWEGLKGRLRG